MLLFAILPGWCSSQTVQDSISYRRDTCVTVSHYCIRYFEKKGLEVRYPWQAAEKNCLFSAAVKNHRISNGLTISGSVSLGIGAGLLCAGLTLLQPHDPFSYQIGRTLIIAGLSSVTVAIPFFVLAPKYRHTTAIQIETLKKL